MWEYLISKDSAVLWPCPSAYEARKLRDSLLTSIHDKGFALLGSMEKMQRRIYSTSLTEAQGSAILIETNSERIYGSEKRERTKGRAYWTWLCRASYRRGLRQAG